jgi:thiol:disulfide interchange protein DsbC
MPPFIRLSSYTATCALLVLALGISHLSALADGGTKPTEQTNVVDNRAGDADLEALRPIIARKLEGKASELHLRRVPGIGLIEVFNEADSRVSYVDEDAKRLFVGSIYSIDDHANLTEAREHELNRLHLSEIPQDRVIKIVKGKGTLKFAVFEDPDCPFCRQMEAKLADFDDYTAYILLFPITDLHPQAEAIAHRIWCSDDPSAAWQGYMRSKTLPADGKSCATPIETLRKLADKHRVTSTPTLVLPDGELLEGLPPLSVLRAKLIRMQGNS